MASTSPQNSAGEALRRSETTGRRLRRVKAQLRVKPLRIEVGRIDAIAPAVLDWLDEQGLTIRRAHVLEAVEWVLDARRGAVRPLSGGQFSDSCGQCPRDPDGNSRREALMPLR